MKKILIYEYPLIHNYKNVLYLDSDIVALNDVNKLFSLIDDENIKDILYVFEEHTQVQYHNERFWGLGNYTSQQLQEFDKRKQGVFNCGHWGFCVSPTMLEHFSNVANMICEYIQSNKTNYFYEQSFMNVYFNTKALTKPVLNGYIFIPYLADKYPFQEDKIILIHVANALETPREKINAMKTWLRSTIV
jgi:lipopolysaccharide biosynthesis glycosyltransferase